MRGFLLFLSIFMPLAFICPKADAARSCKILFEKNYKKGTHYLKDFRNEYSSAREVYKVKGIEKGEQILFQRMNEGKNAIVEAIAYLDANLSSPFLYAKLSHNLKIHEKRWPQILERFGLKNNVFRRFSTIHYTRYFHQEARPLDIVRDLLEAYYRVEIKKAQKIAKRERKTDKRLENQKPLKKSEYLIREIQKLDEVFYRNEEVLQKFWRFDFVDRLSLQYVNIGTTLYRFLSLGVLNTHRINQNDLKAYQQGRLTENLKRLKRAFTVETIRSKATWVILASTIISIPHLITTVRTNTEIKNDIDNAYRNNTSEIKRNFESNFNNNIELMNAQLWLEVNLSQKNHPYEKIVFEMMLKEVENQLYNRAYQKSPQVNEG